MKPDQARVFNAVKYYHDATGMGLQTPNTWPHFLEPVMEAELKSPKQVRGPSRLLIKTKKQHSVWSPSNVNEYYFGTEGNLSYDALAARLAIDAGKGAQQSYWGSLFSGYQGIGRGLSKLKPSPFVRDLQSTLGAAIDSGVVGKYHALEEQASKLRDILRTTKKQSVTKVTAAALEKLQPQVNEAYRAVEAYRIPFLHRWAQKEPAIRMGLALEPKMHPWAEKMLNPQEKKIVARAREYLGGVKAEADALGLPMISGEYAPHTWGTVSRLLSGKHREAALNLFDTKVRPDVKWSQRVPGSLNWMPDIDLMMRIAINQSNDKFGKTKLLKKWYSYLEGAKGTQWEGKGLRQVKPDAYNYAKTWLNEHLEGDRVASGFGRAVDWIVWAEYLSKIGGSLSVAVKHGFKPLFMLAMHPVQTIKASPMALKSGVRMGLKRLGMDVNIGMEDRVLQQLLSSKYIYRAMSGLEETMEGKNKILRAIEVTSSAPVTLVEYLERGMSAYAAMMKGMKKDLNYHEMMRGVYQTMLDINFMGNIDRPYWLDGPLRRLSLLFFYTPFKIVERTFGKWPIGSAAHLAEVYRNRGQVIQGLGNALTAKDYKLFKEGLVKATLKAPKDAFGTSYTQNLVRSLITVGALNELSKATTDTSILGHIVHLPGLRSGAQGTQITMPPYIDVYNKWLEQGGDALAIRQVLFDHFWPTMAMKAHRISSGDIPEIYGGSALRYLSSFPKLSIQKDMTEESADRRRPSLERKRKRYEEYRERNIPPAILRFMGD
jgi:hypothetical protein